MTNKTLLLSHDNIKSLNIDLKEIAQSVKNAYILHQNKKTLMQSKITLRPTDDTFYTTMPCGIEDEDLIGLKLIQRVKSKENAPSICGELILNEYKTGKLLSIMDATWLTSMRTGCIAALSALHFGSKDCDTISIMGLGNTAIAALLFIHELLPNIKNIKILKYKDHTQRFMERFSSYNYNFEEVDEIEDLFKNSKIIISSITYADKPFVKPEWLTDGILAIPIHMRGWQDCDKLFDKMYCDDYQQVKEWLLKKTAELGEVFQNSQPGRENEKEKIIAYNYGTALADLAIAKIIYKKAIESNIGSILNMREYDSKYYI